MHLYELAALRNKACAGLFLALTRRCPLSCSHCSTESELSSEQHAEDPFVSLIDTFTTESRPAVILMSGGEALLRPDLVVRLAEAARAVGTLSYLLTGMYWAREGRVASGAVERALRSVDHVAMSLDEFHEREVSRRDVFHAAHWLRDELGKEVSFQLTGRSDSDPYLEDLIDDVRREFQDDVPILVGLVQPVGRAARLVPHQSLLEERLDLTARPCDRASWPLVHWDGRVFACCNQELVARSRADHLIVGSAWTDSWATLEEQLLTRPMLRAIRALGPTAIANEFAPEALAAVPCQTCIAVGAPAAAQVEAYASSPQGNVMLELIQQVVEGQDPEAFSLRVSAKYGDLVGLGRTA